MDEAAARARQGDLPFFESLDDNTLSQLVKKRDEDGRTLLHGAASAGNLLLCQHLVSKGAAAVVNEADDEQWTALHTASSSGHEAIADLLLSLGVAPHAVTSGGQTPLHYAVSNAPPPRCIIAANTDPRLYFAIDAR